MSVRMSERELAANVNDALRKLGWRLVYHTWTSIHSARGFPDIIAIRGKRLLVVELKSERGTVTPAQQEWLDGFRETGAEVFVWRPADWFAGRITEVLM